MPDPPPMEPRKEGSREPVPALSERILRSLPGLTSFVRRRMGQDLAARESATDIVQSTCRELLRSAAAFEDRGEASFQRWIRSTAEHKLQNRARHWRAARRADAGTPTGSEADGEPDLGARSEPVAPASSRPSQEAILREETLRLQRAFEAVPPEPRRLLIRSQIDGATYAELALECGRSPEAVRKLVARALARLSAGLEDQREP